MTLNNTEFISFLSVEYNEELEADEIKKGVREDLKSWAESHEVQPKAILSAYSLYKKYRNGKNSAAECEDLSELSSIIESYFTTNEE